MKAYGKMFSTIVLTLLLTSMLAAAIDSEVHNFAQSSEPPVQERQVGTLSDPPPTEWNRTYGGTNADYALALVQAGDGGDALAGITWSFGAGEWDFWLVKTDADGNEQWNRTYGGTNADLAYALVQTGDEGYALAGETYSFGAGDWDFWLVKTDADGNLQWNRTYGGTNEDCAYALVQTGDGGYALAGITWSFGAGGDCWLVKTDASGNMQWNRTYGGTNADYAYALVQTGDGGYALAGITESFGAGDWDFWLVKTDADGNLQWNRTYGGTNADYAYALAQTGDEGYALAGYTTSFGAGSYDFWLMKTDADGNEQWNRTYGGTNADLAYALAQTGDGGYALAGGTWSFGAGSYDFWLMKTDASGNMQWNRTYGGISYDFAWDLVQTGDGGYALAGYTISFGAGNYDFWLVKTAPALNIAANEIVPSKNVVGQGRSLSVDVVVQNQGLFPETTDVTLYANSTAISILTDVALPGETSTNVTFTWNTSGFTFGDYTLTAFAEPVPGETYVLDNNMTVGIVYVGVPGDVDGNKIVNMLDLYKIALDFGAVAGQPEYVPNYDVDGNGIINMLDLYIAAIHFGETDP